MVCWTLNFLSRKMLYFPFWGPSRGKEVITVNGPLLPKCHKLQTHSFVILATYSLSQISLDNNWRLTECLFKIITRIYIEIYNLKLLKEDWNIYKRKKLKWWKWWCFNFLFLFPNAIQCVLMFLTWWATWVIRLRMIISLNVSSAITYKDFSYSRNKFFLLYFSLKSYKDIGVKSLNHKKYNYSQRHKDLVLPVLPWFPWIWFF